MLTPNPASNDLSGLAIENVDTVESPGLLFYPERIAENIRRMIGIAGDPQRLRPHVKTHKTPQIVDLQLRAGITKFKCATIAEAEMVAVQGGRDILLAHQPVGPNVVRLRELAARFRETRFLAIVDDPGAARNLSDAFSSQRARLDVLIDIDAGMNRTGIAAGEAARALARTIAALPGLRFCGLHVYDGHLRAPDPAERAAEVAAAMAPVLKLRDELERDGLAPREIVAGGTPTFPCHAATAEVECSPGTCVLWDYGYAKKLPDLDFLWAALVLTRVVSKPALRRVCLDLGNKAIASEGPHPRVFLPALPDARALIHSEEHLVVEADGAEALKVGDHLLGIPMHICPTSAAHREAVTIRDGMAGERWAITARDRHLTV